VSERFYVGDSPAAVGGEMDLPLEESAHLLRVMRLRPGNTLRAFGASREFEATLVRADRKVATIRIDREVPAIPPAVVRLTAAVPWLKGDRNEWLLQKLTELGVARVILFNATREVMHGGERKLGRMQRVALEACKQCGRADVPEICTADSLEAALSAREPLQDNILLHEQCSEPRLSHLLTQRNPTTPLLVATGPEGGFSPEEVEAARAIATLASLGRRVLRAETAPIVAASLAMSAAGEL
jgi:16S rRNA (uracil1498-N3)-methyltransferase